MKTEVPSRATKAEVPMAPAPSWRHAMSRTDRIRVCQHIMSKLSTYYPQVPELSLQEKTSAFENQAYVHAHCRVDYLRRIAGGLSNVEYQVTLCAGVQRAGPCTGA